MSVKFCQFDGVRLLVDLPQHGLKRGMSGCVVDVYAQPAVGYEVEFIDGAGRTIAICAVCPEQIEMTWRDPRATDRNE